MKWSIIQVLFSVAIFVFVIGIVSACDANDRIMKLSDSENAHGAFYDNAVFTTDICFSSSFTGTFSAPHDGTGVVLKLSDTANAHAEEPDGIVYTQPVKYGDLDCVLKDNSDGDENCSDVNGEVGNIIASLSGETNAHIAKGYDGDFDWILCCASETPGIVPICDYDGICEFDDRGETSDNCVDCLGILPPNTCISPGLWVDGDGDLFYPIIDEGYCDNVDVDDDEWPNGCCRSGYECENWGDDDSICVSTGGSCPESYQMTYPVGETEDVAVIEYCDDVNEYDGDYDNMEKLCEECTSELTMKDESPNGLPGSCIWTNEASDEFECYFAFPPINNPSGPPVCITKYLETGSCADGVATKEIKYTFWNVGTGQYDSECDPDGCTATGCTEQIYCPKVLKLPFFTSINAIISLIMVAGIYAFLFARKK